MVSTGSAASDDQVAPSQQSKGKRQSPLLRPLALPCDNDLIGLVYGQTGERHRCIINPDAWRYRAVALFPGGAIPLHEYDAII